MAGIYSSAHIAPEGLVDGSDEVFLSGRRDYAPTDYPNNHGFAAMEPYSTESVCDLPAYNFNHSSQRVNDIHPGQSAKDMYQNQVLHTPVRVTLEQYQLWQQFHSVGTEMILTKSGRRMFPGCRIRLAGLNPDARYCVLMSVERVDGSRYRFQHGHWVAAGPGEVEFPKRYFIHQDSPATGEKWMKSAVSFHKVKLTNSNASSNFINGKLIVHSMHLYCICVHLVESNDPTHVNYMQSFPLPLTTFVTVTAYQNTELTKLKIANNPFAKGFREDGARGTKNPRRSSSEDMDSAIMVNRSKQHYSESDLDCYEESGQRRYNLHETEKGGRNFEHYSVEQIVQYRYNFCPIVNRPTSFDNRSRYPNYNYPQNSDPHVPSNHFHCDNDGTFSMVNIPPGPSFTNQNYRGHYQQPTHQTQISHHDASFQMNTVPLCSRLFTS